ncbi:MAG TPA: hypothetical protein VGO96_11330 [Pyrinomonadaceae bacterium]|jgi:hypothetical protein|nr:hypothetical protein [Pyrinomonadaceae bacterium]
MNTHFGLAPSQHFNATVSAIVLLAFFLVLGGLGSVSSTAQSPQEEGELEDRIPKHLPIKVKVKHLNKKDWVREVEVEVTNTGFKPIYYVGFNLLLPEVFSEAGNNVAVSFRYGRPELGLFENRPTPEDVPIQPGETCILKVPEKEMRGWESARKHYKWSEPKKFRLKFYHLHYGDGTGFMTSGGLPVPNPNPTSSSCGGGGRQATTTQRAASGGALKPPLAPSFQFAPALLPVKFLPANLFVERTVEPISNSAAPQAGVCCPGRFGCFSGREVPQGHTCTTCGPAAWVESAPCGSFGSYCGKIEDENRSCRDDDGNEVGCTDYFLEAV